MVLTRGVLVVGLVVGLGGLAGCGEEEGSAAAAPATRPPTAATSGPAPGEAPSSAEPDWEGGGDGVRRCTWRVEVTGDLVATFSGSSGHVATGRDGRTVFSTRPYRSSEQLGAMTEAELEEWMNGSPQLQVAPDVALLHVHGVTLHDPLGPGDLPPGAGEDGTLTVEGLGVEDLSHEVRADVAATFDCPGS